MNSFLMPLAQMLAMSVGAGGLFDFNATLPIMALQFIALTTILTFVYYKPVGTLLEERETLISNNLTNASERLLKADELYQQYDEQLKDARNKAQGIIQVAETEAKEIVASEIAQARKDAASLIDKTNRDLEAQKNLALEKLETQVDELSDLIKEKLLGKEVIL
jgi:F-type H+-transporting ATPase subunit b